MSGRHMVMSYMMNSIGHGHGVGVPIVKVCGTPILSNDLSTVAYVLAPINVSASGFTASGVDCDSSGRC